MFAQTAVQLWTGKQPHMNPSAVPAKMPFRELIERCLPLVSFAPYPHLLSHPLSDSLSSSLFLFTLTPTITYSLVLSVVLVVMVDPFRPFSLFLPSLRPFENPPLGVEIIWEFQELQEFKTTQSHFKRRKRVAKIKTRKKCSSCTKLLHSFSCD